MSQQSVYGGDEIGAIVVDPGSYYTRIGFAGEDSPKIVTPTTVGRQVNPNYDPEQLQSADDEQNGNNNAQNQYNYFFDDSMNTPRPNSVLIDPLNDGIVEDWDATQALWDWGLLDRLRVDTKEHPMLLTEQTWNSDTNRAKSMELAFEHYQVPAFYLVKTPVSALLTSNKGGSGLVVDVGDKIATVTPVIDGLVLYKPSRRTRIAGHFLGQQVGKLCSKENIKVLPRFEIKNKKPVSLGQSPEFEKKEYEFEIDQSYYNYHKNAIYHEFKESQCQVSEQPFENKSEENNSTEKRVFEFPTGESREFGNERFEISESLFDPKKHETEGYSTENDPHDESANKNEDKDPLYFTDRSTEGFRYEGISKLILESINACDVEVRPNLANNIIITGGSTLTQGFTDRINAELTNELPGLKIRLYAPGNTVERKNAAWLGGSILASLGTFHQLWISKKEYDEVGVNRLLEKRFR